MAERAKQVIDIRVSKGITAAQSIEHQRGWSEKGWKNALGKGNYDRTREHLNFEIVRGGRIQPIDKRTGIPERMAETLRRRGIKDPNEGLAEPKFRTVVNFIFGGSRERMNELAFGKQEVDFQKGADNSSVGREKAIEQWAKDVYAFVSGRYGEEKHCGFHSTSGRTESSCPLHPIADKGRKVCLQGNLCRERQV